MPEQRVGEPDRIAIHHDQARGDGLAQVPLLFESGTEWAYSMASDVLGRVVEVLSGRPIADFFATEILTPLGIGPDMTRVLGLVLAVATFAAFTLAAATVIGLLPAGMWPAAVAAGAGSSIALLLLFFHPWLALGLVIDAVLLWAVIVTGWTPDLSPPPASPFYKWRQLAEGGAVCRLGSISTGANQTLAASL